jgi:hypothetical protein
MSNGPKDRWDKADIILKPAGGLLTALAVAWIGYGLNLHQADETNVRLYADLMGKREEADTSLRKDMFNSAIKSFVESKPVTLHKEILDLELLAYNFHESIDLGPIFKDVYSRILDKQTPVKERDKYRERVERLAKEVIDREIPALEAEGKLDADFSFEDVKPEGYTAIEGSLPIRQTKLVNQESISLRRDFRVTVLRVNPERREMRMQLEVRTPQQGDVTEPGKRNADYVQSTFWVGFSDFPMIDNTRLSEGYRCAIVLRRFDEQGASITLVYFPTSRAALKDKPYYDEVMDDLLRARKHIARHNKPQP